MSNNNKTDYGELFCEAIDTIVAERLNAVAKDITVLCTVVDDSKRKEGKYVVTETNAQTKFEAFSDNTEYRNDNNVYVTIPEGDMNQAKFIIGKKQKDEIEQAYTYTRPFDTIVDVSGNLITADGNLTTETTSGVTVDNLTITVNHNEVSRNDGDKGTKTQESKKTLTFDAVESITTDAYGHITAVKTNGVTVTDTHNTLTDAETVISSKTNGVGLITTVKSGDGNVSTDEVLVTSDSLAIGVKADATNTIVAELVWEAFA